MRANRAKNTKPEILMRTALRDVGIPGYRLHWKRAPGKPDIAYPGKKTAIFVNGCFWHRCPHCNLPLPKSNTDYWRQKFERNVQRDSEKTKALESAGWTVFSYWECEIKADSLQCATQVKIHLMRMI
jgi:DNA mismatch endonuclease (patch repair protein)